MVVDDQDEWEEEIKRSLRYHVGLLIKHPNIDPARLTERLRLQPDSFQIAGAPRMTPKGNPLPGMHRESGWSHWFGVERNRFFFEDVAKLIDILEPHKDFLHQIVNEGGRIEVIVYLPGDINIGSSLQWRDMARLAALRINLGIEVF